MTRTHDSALKSLLNLHLGPSSICTDRTLSPFLAERRAMLVETLIHQPVLLAKQGYMSCLETTAP